MCWDKDGNFMGCYAPEYCHPPEEDEDDKPTEEEIEALKEMMES